MADGDSGPNKKEYENCDDREWEGIILANIISVVGPHNSGKTTVLCSLVAELRERGARVAIIKHSHHSFSFAAGEDTERLFLSGADKVYFVSRAVMVSYERTDEEPDIGELAERLKDQVDLIIIEGYKKGRFPKVEVVRAEISREFLNIEGRVALVTDMGDVKADVPVFAMNDTSKLADFIWNSFMAGNRRAV